ncbi:MAG: helix-turn-helix domain-containing protein [Deltaproteobacteria bacterium]|nr:helix-turn-helix domain-containing protein [Deltaproteobacteria bacterium]
MHFGTLLRIMRTDAGLSLRQLAAELDVSSAYLSRVENGHDPTPTPDRLVAIARALRVSPGLLLELTDNSGTAVASYVQRVPSAAALFVDIAERELGPAEIATLHAILDERFPKKASAGRRAPRVSELLTPDRVVTRLAVTDWEDVLDIAAARLGPASQLPVRRVREALEATDASAPSAIGGGLAIPNAVVSGARQAGALLVLARPLAVETPDGRPLRVVLATLQGRPGAELLARAARIATLRLPEALSGLADPEACLRRLAELER